MTETAHAPGRGLRTRSYRHSGCRKRGISSALLPLRTTLLPRAPFSRSLRKARRNHIHTAATAPGPVF
ncbi:hypothetical protein D3C87_1741600 [compost metagenome]